MDMQPALVRFLMPSTRGDMAMTTTQKVKWLNKARLGSRTTPYLKMKVSGSKMRQFVMKKLYTTAALGIVGVLEWPLIHTSAFRRRRSLSKMHRAALVATILQP